MVPPISIVMTVYNRERYLSKAIDSVLAQTLKNFELLIWDDGSTDSSVEIAKSYAERDQRVQIVVAEHLGQGKALKGAIAETTGTYVGQLDSDDFLASTALEETAAILDNQPEVGLVYTDYLVIDEKGVVKGTGNRCQTPYSKDRLLVEFMIFHFRLMRRSLYEQVGGIREEFEAIEDYELCLRLSEVTEIQQLKKPLYYYRTHDRSLSRERQVEQILLSQQAINQALERRGLADCFESEVQIIGRFSLKQKQKKSIDFSETH
jgi:glycosyltransferase involved in cell wall biosynthesis